MEGQTKWVTLSESVANLEKEGKCSGGKRKEVEEATRCRGSGRLGLQGWRVFDKGAIKRGVQAQKTLNFKVSTGTSLPFFFFVHRVVGAGFGWGCG